MRTIRVDYGLIMRERKQIMHYYAHLSFFIVRAEVPPTLSSLEACHQLPSLRGRVLLVTRGLGLVVDQYAGTHLPPTDRVG